MLLKRILIAVIAVVAAGLLAFALVKGARLLTGTEQDRTGAIIATSEANLGGPFTLTDTDGKTVTNADFRGRFMLIYFGYGFCPDVCPTELQAMGRALDALGPGGADHAGIHQCRSGARYARQSQALCAGLSFEHDRPDRNAGADRRRGQGIPRLLSAGPTE